MLSKVVLAVFVLLPVYQLQADVSSNFGSGIKAFGSSGAVFSSEDDVLSVYSVPAGLSYFRKASFSAQSIFSYDAFKKIDSVVTDSEKYGGSLVSNSSVDVDTPNTQNLSLAMALPLSEEKQSSLGLYLNTPVGKLMSVESQSAFYPAYASYLSDAQRFTANMNYAWKSSSQWRYSLGLHLFFLTGSTVVSRLPSSSVGNPRSSNMDMKVDIKPGLALAFSALKEVSHKDVLAVSFVGERDGRFNFKAETEVNVFGPSSIPISIEGTSSLFYDPNQLSFSWNRKFMGGDLFASLVYANWSKYNSSIILLDISGANSFEQLNIDVKYKDTLNPSMAYVFHTKNYDWGFGYSHRPNNIKSQTEESNLIDTDKQIYSFFLERKKADKLFGFVDWKNSWGLGLQWHRLNNKTVYKTETDSVGYPKYDVGGNLFAISAQLNLEI